MNTIATLRDLDEARSQPRALVLLWVNWAIQASRSRHLVCELASRWEAVHPDVAVPVYLADLSDQQGEVWDAVRSWLEAEARPVDQLTFGGAGSLLWVRTGRIVAHVPFVGHYDLSKLLGMSRGAFEAK